MPLADKEQRRQYINEWRKQNRRKQGLQKQGRKPLTEAEQILSDKHRKEYQKQWQKEIGEKNTARTLVYQSRRRAKSSGRSHTITEEDITIPTHCPYLGIELQQFNRNRGTCRDAWPTLDRIDNSKGYEVGNVEVVSFLANTMKNSATKEQLIGFAKEILKRYGETS